MRLVFLQSNQDFCGFVTVCLDRCTLVYRIQWLTRLGICK